MPYTTFADGSVLTASQVNTNFRDQVISTVTSGTRPSGTEGQIIYETDTDRFYVYNGGWVEWGGLGAWVSYTPTLTQSAAVTKTVTSAKYSKKGRDVTVAVVLTVTANGTANAAVNVTLPFTASLSGDLPIGTGKIYDASAGTNYPGLVVLPNTTSVQFLDSTQASAGSLYLGHTGTAFAAAIANPDVISFSATYEATS